MTLLSHWLWNSSRSWEATARELHTLSDGPKGTRVLGKTLLPTPFVGSYFFLLWQERSRVCSTFLLPTQESVGVSRRKQGLQSWPMINAPPPPPPLLDSHGSTTKAMAWFLWKMCKGAGRNGASFYFQALKPWGWGWEGLTSSAQVPVTKIVFKTY